MEKLIDTWGEFHRRCKACGWEGFGRDMESAESFEAGVDKHCPACGERLCFAPYSTVVDVPDSPEGDDVTTPVTIGFLRRF